MGYSSMEEYRNDMKLKSMLKSFPLYPHFYDLDIIKNEVNVLKINKILTDFHNNLPRSKRAEYKGQRCYMIRKYAATKSKNFLRKYIDEIKRREPIWEGD